MARKKGSSRRRSFPRAKRRSSRRSNTGAKANMAALMGAGLYGAARQRISSTVAPFLGRLPGGAIADEIGMFGVNWAAGKFIGRKVSIIRDMAKAGMLIEAAAIGEALAGGQLTGGGNGNGAVIG